MANSTLTIGSVCTGIGMLDEAVRLGCEYLGWRAVPAFVCEWESYASATLLARMADASLEPCPIWCGDLADFDGKPWRGCVDIFAAGLPCQPYSVAGKQQGLSDKRSYGEDGSGPIPNALRIIAECAPAVVFFENVPPWVSGGWFRPVGEELCRLGYTVESPLFVTAESVGAAHRRERVFVLAYRPGTGGQLFRRVDAGQGGKSESEVRSGRVRGQQRPAIHEQPELRGSELADSARRGQRELRESPERDGQPDGSDELMANTKPTKRRRKDSRRGSVNGIALGGTGGDVGNAQRSRRPQGNTWNETTTTEAAPIGCDPRIFAPGPGADWRAIDESLYPAVESGVRVLVDGLAVVVDESRADQLRCGGNGVVAIQGAAAFIELVRRAIK